MLKGNKSGDCFDAMKPKGETKKPKAMVMDGTEKEKEKEEKGRDDGKIKTE